jgi:hypothetical protein
LRLRKSVAALTLLVAALAAPALGQQTPMTKTVVDVVSSGTALAVGAVPTDQTIDFDITLSLDFYGTSITRRARTTDTF